jgi:hypothetical protein
MGLETLGQHIAGIRNVEASTREMTSATRTREALLPGRVESLDLSNEQANLMLSELYKDAELRKWARDNEIHEAQALNHYYTNNKEELFANVAIRERKTALGNSFDLASKEADMIYLSLDPLLTDLTNVINSPEMSTEEVNQVMQGINQIYDGHMLRWINDGTLGEEDRQEDGIIRPDGGLPGGVSQGDPLTKESLGALGLTTRVMKRMSEIGREEAEKQAGKALGPKDRVDLQKGRVDLGGDKRQLIQENLWGAFPNTTESTDTGKRNLDEWESANFELTRVLEGATTETGDPMNEAQALTQWARQSLEPGTIDFDAGGTILDGTINTYLPTAQLGEFTVQNMYNPGKTTLNRDTYINMLKQRIKGMSEEEAQRTANLMFTNMVTSLLLRK